ncbi:MAG: PKD domain-containing protein [Bacteroidia bacterium]
MENKLDEIIKKAALEQEEVYHPEYWDAFEKKLNAYKKPNNNWMKYAAGAAVVVATVAIINYFTNSNELNVPVTENKTNTTEKLSKTKETEKNTVESERINTNQPVENKVVNQNKTSVLVIEKEGVRSDSPIENKLQTTNEEKTNLSPKNEIVSNNIIEQNLPKITIDLKKSIVCEGEQFNVYALNIPENAVVSWDFGDGKSSSKIQATHVYNKAGSYQIELNCFKDKKLIHKESLPITVVSNPKADFEWTDKNSELEENYTISFKDKSYDAISWEWNFGDKTVDNTSNPIHTYKGQGTYAVSLTVTNMNGCKDQKTEFVSVVDQNPLLAPNSFSPNGDGLNDYFMPKLLETNNINFELKILDRAGNIIYVTNDSNKPWNGRFNNTGELMNNGTPYFWMVTIFGTEGKIKRFNGTINIVN